MTNKINNEKQTELILWSFLTVGTSCVMSWARHCLSAANQIKRCEPSHRIIRFALRPASYLLPLSLLRGTDHGINCKMVGKQGWRRGRHKEREGNTSSLWVLISCVQMTHPFVKIVTERHTIDAGADFLLALKNFPAIFSTRFLIILISRPFLGTSSWKDFQELVLRCVETQNFLLQNSGSGLYCESCLWIENMTVSSDISPHPLLQPERDAFKAKMSTIIQRMRLPQAYRPSYIVLFKVPKEILSCFCFKFV